MLSVSSPVSRSRQTATPLTRPRSSLCTFDQGRDVKCLKLLDSECGARHALAMSMTASQPAPRPANALQPTREVPGFGAAPAPIAEEREPLEPHWLQAIDAATD